MFHEMTMFREGLMFRLCSVLIGYMFGCMQTSYFLGKLKGIDIRNYGSGSAGMTNANRVLGGKIAIIVFVCDVLKSILAYCLCTSIFKYNLAGVWAGIGVVLGHDFPFFLGFRGGKGIASTIGLSLVLNWRGSIIGYLFAISAIFVSRKVSVGSMVLIIVLPFCFLKFSGEILTAMILISVLDLWQHRQNIVRIISGNEPNIF